MNWQPIAQQILDKPTKAGVEALLSREETTLLSVRSESDEDWDTYHAIIGKDWLPEALAASAKQRDFASKEDGLCTNCKKPFRLGEVVRMDSAIELIWLPSRWQHPANCAVLVEHKPVSILRWLLFRSTFDAQGHLLRKGKDDPYDDD